ncbi:hypothetical protein [Segnochrobactrum spirostomi]|uniref:hypothetical protein n=1 Tax=Segnochrobactrum spirostomi TaxID=2608987 RepID=UPI001AD81CC6|nr:hypothetical protein [Segnochrobactrum spirostomi]
MLAIRLPPDLESRLESLAKTTGRTERDHVLTAIADYLDGIEERRKPAAGSQTSSPDEPRRPRSTMC